MSVSMSNTPYALPRGVQSRAISFENPTGAKGAGGQAASGLGAGRKGDPVRVLPAGQTFELADIEGPGTLRHIWMTTQPDPKALRGLVIRIYWEGQEHPSVEAPIGDFFGFAHGVPTNYASAVHSLGEAAGMNIWMPMPFSSRARVTLSNDLETPVAVFFQIDYTIGDQHPEDFGCLHVFFQRHNPTVLKEDMEMLPRREGRGVFMGAVIGVRPLEGKWWGEGEVKCFIDGDTELPTIAGTGAEDYVGHSFGIQDNWAPYNGASYREFSDDTETGRVSIYRWHHADPIYWSQDIRITLQQIGCCRVPPRTIKTYIQESIYERQDDVSCAAFWYEPAPSAPLPHPLPDVAARIADLPAQAKQATLD